MSIIYYFFIATRVNARTWYLHDESTVPGDPLFLLFFDNNKKKLIWKEEIKKERERDTFASMLVKIFPS